MSQLVPNRECGACTACCQYLTIDAPELQVMPGVLCANCTHHKGCTIYETRPQVCRDHMCGWRLFSIFDDSWRPDKIGVLVSVVTGISPEPYSQEGLDLLITHPDIALASPAFPQFLKRSVTARVPIFISALRPIGNVPARLFVNTYLENQNDDADILTIIRAVLENLGKTELKPVMFKNKKV